MTDEAPAILGRYSPAGEDEQITVTLLNFPLQVFEVARQRHDELLREFALLALQAPEDRPDRSIPAELLTLIDTLGRRYAGAGDRTDKVRDEAVARGEITMDLTYRVPASVGDAMRELQDLMDAADSFCGTEQLLTLAATPAERGFRHWFTEQFIAQAAHEDPVPWDGPLTLG